MKHSVLTFCMVLLLINNLCAQPTLTKQETISYIQKKMSEGLSHKFDDYTLTINDIVISECNVKITIMSKNHFVYYGERSDYTSDYQTYHSTYSFDPRLISEITEYAPSTGSLKKLKIKFSGNSVSYSYWNDYYKAMTQTKWVRDYTYQAGGYYQESMYFILADNRDDKVESTGTVYVSFLGTDPTNFNKLKKAFEHLKDLCEAEDDPFGN